MKLSPLRRLLVADCKMKATQAGACRSADSDVVRRTRYLLVNWLPTPLVLIVIRGWHVEEAGIKKKKSKRYWEIAKIRFMHGRNIRIIERT